MFSKKRLGDVRPFSIPHWPYSSLIGSTDVLFTKLINVTAIALSTVTNSHASIESNSNK
jgi:hypothetical protein